MVGNIPYRTSKNYARLKNLVDAGHRIVCFCTYDWDEGYNVTDVCIAICNDGRYQISTRGIEYCSYWDGMARYSSFEDACKQCDIEFIEPTNL